MNVADTRRWLDQESDAGDYHETVGMLYEALEEIERLREDRGHYLPELDEYRGEVATLRGRLRQLEKEIAGQTELGA